MKKRMVFLLLGILMISIIPINSANATSVKVYTDKPTYSYGEFLTFTIEVSEVTGDSAIMHIRDENGVSSSAIPIEIKKLNTTIPSKIPFDSEIYKVGKYFIDVEYSDDKSSTEFNLVESEGIVIPYTQKLITTHWLLDEISDEQFLQSVKSLVEKKVIIIDNDISTSKNPSLPTWVKTISQWMLEGKISDNDYGVAIQYLIKTGIIVI